MLVFSRLTEALLCHSCIFGGHSWMLLWSLVAQVPKGLWSGTLKQSVCIAFRESSICSACEFHLPPTLQECNAAHTSCLNDLESIFLLPTVTQSWNYLSHDGSWKSYWRASIFLKERKSTMKSTPGMSKLCITLECALGKN